MKKGLMERLTFLLIAALFAVGSGGVVWADDDVEWDPTWGYHEEEWYDPSDWFGTDGSVAYEDQYYGGHYMNRDATDRPQFWTDELTEDDYGYDQDTLSKDPGFDYGRDYYTDDWFDDESEFDDWWDD